MTDGYSRAAFIFGQPMAPCPTCGGYDMGPCVPIKMGQPADGETAPGLIRRWARAYQDGPPVIEGRAYLRCRTCGHEGPAVDCTGRSQKDVLKDPVIAAEVKRLWNEQTAPEVSR